MLKYSVNDLELTYSDGPFTLVCVRTDALIDVFMGNVDYLLKNPDDVVWYASFLTEEERRCVLKKVVLAFKAKRYTVDPI